MGSSGTLLLFKKTADRNKLKVRAIEAGYIKSTIPWIMVKHFVVTLHLIFITQ